MNDLALLRPELPGALTTAEIDATMAYAENEKSASTRAAYASDWQGKAPATADLIGQMLALCQDTMIGKRDRALLCLGFAGAFRRSELCALQVADLTEVPDGLRILIRRSKGDQEGQGQEVAIPRGYKLRPVEAVQTWLVAAEISTGPCSGR